MRVIVEEKGPIHVLLVTDLDSKFQQTFYMLNEHFTLNATILTWIKKKMKSINKGVARERKLSSI